MPYPPPEVTMFARARALSLVAAVAVPSILGAQGVIVQSTSDMRLFGALGTMVNIAAKFGGGGNMHDIPSTTSIAGHKMRVETRDAATIIDADAGRFTHVDLKDKTFTSMTFEDMTAAMQQAASSAKANSEKVKAEQAKDPKAAKGDIDVKYNVSVDRPGQREKIAGYDAERVFLTITLEAEAKPENEKAEQVGSMVFLLDLWRSKDAPQIAAVEEFQRAYAKRLGQAFQPQQQSLEAVFKSDPRIKGGFEAAAKELAKVPGVALRSVTYVALVPPNMTFDRKLALGDAAAAAAAASAEPEKKAEEKPRSRFGGFVGAIKSAAEQAGKTQSSSDKKDKQDLKQTTMMSITDEVKSIDRGPVPADAFLPPAGFREIKPRMPSNP
jgi:hypothetical protein